MKTVADRVGCTERAIRFWESGDRRPTYDWAPRLCEVLGQPISWLYETEEAA